MPKVPGRQTYLEPIQYTVGGSGEGDISDEDYQASLEAITNWLSESRPKEKEPASLARRVFQECLDGKTQDGGPWFGAASSTLQSRVKIKCRFDLEKMVPLRTANEKQKAKKAREKVSAAKRKKASEVDHNIPDEIRKNMEGADPNTVQYGDDANLLLSSAERVHWEATRDEYVRQFPELREINAKSELDLLCDMIVRAERYRLRALKGETVDARATIGVVEQLDKLKRALGIHPDQLAKRTKASADTSIAAAAAKVESIGGHRELRMKFWTEEMIQIYQMFHSEDALGTGRQLDEVGLFGLTRCRTCACAGCGMHNFVGLEIQAIEDHLVKSGNLVPVPDEEEDAEAATTTAE